MKKKLLSLLVALVLCFTLLPTASFASTGGHSQSDAVNWAYARGNEEWAVDFDGAARVQCVDLIKAYYDYLGNGPADGNAEDYTWNSLPNGWTRIRYYSGFEPQAGDILVWDSTFCEYGHVAIALYTENGIVGCAETRNIYVYPNNYRCHFWEYGVSSIWGVIRPDFSSASVVAR